MEKSEMETIIRFDRSDGTASIYTADTKMIRKYDALCAKNAEAVKKRQDQYGAEYTCPKGWVIIKPPRTVSEENKAKMSERMKAMHEAGKLG